MPSRNAKQFDPRQGQEAYLHLPDGVSIRLTAQDFSGAELPLYCEVLTDEDSPEPAQPRLFCPSCGDGLLETGPIIGPNSLRPCTCPNCQYKWQVSDNLMSKSNIYYPRPGAIAMGDVPRAVALVAR
jgi:hypothetical protein